MKPDKAGHFALSLGDESRSIGQPNFVDMIPTLGLRYASAATAG
jgi:hypothetical protein